MFPLRIEIYIFFERFYVFYISSAARLWQLRYPLGRYQGNECQLILQIVHLTFNAFDPQLEILLLLLFREPEKLANLFQVESHFLIQHNLPDLFQCITVIQSVVVWRSLDYQESFVVVILQGTLAYADNFAYFVDFFHYGLSSLRNSSIRYHAYVIAIGFCGKLCFLFQKRACKLREELDKSVRYALQSSTYENDDEKDQYDRNASQREGKTW